MLRLSYRGKSGQKNVTMPNWAFALMAAGSAALGIALFLVVSTLALVLLPLVLIAGGVAAFMLRKRIERLLRQGGFPVGEPEAAARRKRSTRRPGKPDIEDAEYRVVDDPPKPRG